MEKIKLVFAEGENEIIREAVGRAATAYPEVECVAAKDLKGACEAVRDGAAAGMVAGIEYTSREVILNTRDIIGFTGATFSASFLMEKGDKRYLVADAAACKEPSKEQLYDIVMQTYDTARVLLDEEPRVAMLSWSTLGSGGSDPVVDKMVKVCDRIKVTHSEILIDGEMQLDAAVNALVGGKKAPDSPVAGRANVLIVPDLNSGNILYKAMEQFGGFTAAGPILQGFKAPVSDLSRGSTVEDVLLVIGTLAKIIRGKEK